MDKRAAWLSGSPRPLSLHHSGQEGPGYIQGHVTKTEDAPGKICSSAVLLVEIENGPATQEDCSAVSYKTKHALSIQSKSPTAICLGIYPREMNTHVHRYIHKNLCS